MGVKKIKLGIVDDDVQVQKVMQGLLNSQKDFDLCLIANSLGELFLQVDHRTELNVLLLDIKLSEGSSLDHLTKVKRLLPRTAIIMFTGHHESLYIKQAISEGIDGFLLKGSDPNHYLTAIREVAQGNAYMDPITTRSAFQSLQPPGFQQEFGLLDIEAQIVQGLLEGLSYKMIGGRLKISIDSVRYNIKNIYKKVGINSKIELLNRIKKI